MNSESVISAEWNARFDLPVASEPTFGNRTKSYDELQIEDRRLIRETRPSALEQTLPPGLRRRGFAGDGLLQPFRHGGRDRNLPRVVTEHFLCGRKLEGGGVLGALLLRDGFLSLALIQPGGGLAHGNSGVVVGGGSGD